jgi:hypothetical protein
LKILEKSNFCKNLLALALDMRFSSFLSYSESISSVRLGEGRGSSLEEEGFTARIY